MRRRLRFIDYASLVESIKAAAGASCAQCHRRAQDAGLRFDGKTGKDYSGQRLADHLATDSTSTNRRT
jgi:hypothetical protein